MSYGEFARLTATNLDRAVDVAIKNVNDDYLKLLREHSCSEHYGQMLSLDGQLETRCLVCYKTK